MLVQIFGPNLRDTSKGQFHVHDSECQDCKNYGPGKKFGGEEGMTLAARARQDVVKYVFADQLAEGASWVACRGDIYFAPCTDGKFR